MPGAERDDQRTAARRSVPVHRAAWRRLIYVFAFLGLLCTVVWPVPVVGSGVVSAYHQRQVTVRIRYQMPEANMVFLVWGLDNWEKLPLEQRPAGTRLKNDRMQTPMALEDGTFFVDLQVPLGATIRYGFLITETYTGQDIEVWETGARGAYVVIATRDLSVGTKTKLSLAPVTLDVRYRIEGAGEVLLAWGINGWNALPDAQLPAGTVVEKGTMRTPMTREGNVFVATVQVAPYTKVNYGFFIVQTADGSTAAIWERERDFRMTVPERGGVLEIDSSLRLEGDMAQATLGNGPPATLEILYHAPEADEVLLVWGVNGWFPISEEARPAGTVVEEGLMRTPMARAGDRYVSKLPVSVGTRVDFGFLATTMEDGAPKRAWDGSDDYRLVIAQQELVVDVDAQEQQKRVLDPTAVVEADLPTELEATPAPSQESGDADTTRIGVYLLLLGGALLAGVAAVLLVRWALGKSGY